MAKPFRKSGSKNYYVELWSHGRRQTIALGTDNFGIARARAAQLELESQTTGLSLPTQHEIGALVQRYVEHMAAHRRRKAAQTDTYRLRELLGGANCAAITDGIRANRAAAKRYPFRLRLTHVEQVTTSLLLKALTELAEQRRIGPKTWNEYRGTLHGFFEWATRTAGVILLSRTNPAALLPTRTVAPPEITFLNLTQVREQLNALAKFPQVKAMVATYIYAGLRREELLWLTPADVDFERRALHVRAKVIAGDSWSPKTNRNRRVPISQTLLGHLVDHKPPSASPWFFPSPEGARWDPDNFSHRLAELNRRASLSWSCAEYRHTFGTQLAMAGRDERTIAELMGNSPAIVRRHYAAWLPEAHPEAVEFDCPDGPAKMSSTATANTRLEAERRGLRVVRAEAVDR